jgi:hypothetical protein
MSKNLPGWTDVSRVMSQSKQQVSWPRFELGPSGNEVGMQTTRLRLSVSVAFIFQLRLGSVGSVL